VYNRTMHVENLCTHTSLKNCPQFFIECN